MGKFLNTEAINIEFGKILDTAKSEVVIITPYLNLTESMIRKFLELSKKGVEILLIHRDDKIDPVAKQKMQSISNLTTLHHPTVHAKCFFNESRMIIGSFNLLEYSQKNNREMGVLILNDDNIDTFAFDDFEIFEDCLNEVKQIVNASEIVQRSVKCKEDFFFIFLKDTQTLLHQVIITLNKHFENKIFKPSTVEFYESCAECTHYREKVKLLLDINIYDVNNKSFNWNINRSLLYLSHPINQLSELRNEFKENYTNFKVKKDFKYYWNKPEKPIYIYPSREFNISNVDQIKLYKGELENIMRFFNTYKSFQKIYCTQHIFKS